MLKAGIHKTRQFPLWSLTVFLLFITLFSIFISTNPYSFRSQHKIELVCKTIKAASAKSVFYLKNTVKTCVQKNSYSPAKRLKTFLQYYNVLEKVKLAISQQRAISFTNPVSLALYTVYHSTSDLTNPAI